jgi:hypothetical protein
MYTYLICDPVSKKFYVGSGKNKSRTLRHLNGKSCNNHLANITAKRNVFADPELHRQRVTESHNSRKNNDHLYTEKMRRAQRGSVLTRVGFNGVYPEKLGYRTSLSETFILYYTHFGLNNARN